LAAGTKLKYFAISLGEGGIGLGDPPGMVDFAQRGRQSANGLVNVSVGSRWAWYDPESNNWVMAIPG